MEPKFITVNRGNFLSNLHFVLETEYIVISLGNFLKSSKTTWYCIQQKTGEGLKYFRVVDSRSGEMKSARQKNMTQTQ